MWCPKLGKTLPKGQESGVYTLIICKSQSKKSEQKIAQPAGSARSAQSAWSAVCVLSWPMQPLWSAVDSRGQWVGKFEETKEIVYVTKAIKFPRVCLEHQRGNRPHVSSYDKLWAKIYIYIYIYLWEPGEFSLFKRKPLSLIFGIQNNKFEYLIKHLISVRVK